MTKYSIKKVDKKFSNWDEILSKSDQCNIYFNSVFLTGI